MTLCADSTNGTQSALMAGGEGTGVPSKDQASEPVGYPQKPVERGICLAPDRYRNALGKYRIRRSPDCSHCGKCAELCPRNVHVKPEGYAFTLRPRDHRCIGPSCADTDHYCVSQCAKQALSMSLNPTVDCMGDARWTADLIFATWHMAETGHAPPHLERECGNSAGGFDRLRFDFGATPSAIDPRTVDTSLVLNRRGDDRPRVNIDLPIYGGCMSPPTVSIQAILGRARAAAAWNTFTCTSATGYPDRLGPYDSHVITLVTTEPSEAHEREIRRARVVEFKYAHGRCAGDGLKKAIASITRVNPRALVSVKVSTPTNVGELAVAGYHAGAHIVHLEGSYAGSEAAPDIVKKNVGAPIEYAISKVHRALCAEGIRDSVTLIAGGGVRNANDVMKAIALGADGVAIGTAELVALGCIRCGCCSSERGCPRGLVSAGEGLTQKMSSEWAGQRIINLLHAWRERMVDTLVRLGLPSVQALRGRRDLLYYLAAQDQATP